jgi:hypothetical protein
MFRYVSWSPELSQIAHCRFCRGDSESKNWGYARRTAVPVCRAFFMCVADTHSGECQKSTNHSAIRLCACASCTSLQAGSLRKLNPSRMRGAGPAVPPSEPPRLKWRGYAYLYAPFASVSSLVRRVRRARFTMIEMRDRRSSASASATAESTCLAARTSRTRTRVSARVTACSTVSGEPLVKTRARSRARNCTRRLSAGSR